MDMRHEICIEYCCSLLSHLAPRCTPAVDYEHGTLHCLRLHVVFTHHLHETSGNVFAISLERARKEKKEQVESAERMAETCPTKLLIILDWTRAPPFLLSLYGLRSQALIIKRPQWGRETESYKKLPVYDVSARRNH